MKDIPVRKISSSETKPSLFGDFKIMDVHELLNGTDMVHNLHRHDFFFVLILTQGSGDHQIDFVDYKVSPNSLFIIRPGQVHQLNLKKDSCGFLLQFSAPYSSDQNSISPLLRLVSAKNHFILEPLMLSELIKLSEFMLEEHNKQLPNNETIIKSYLHIFLHKLNRVLNIPIKTDENESNYNQELLDHLFELLELNIYTTKKVSEYANFLNISSYQLNSITKSQLNKTCSEVIYEFVILEAKRLLLATSKQVQEIALQLGYEDVSYFIRFFKKHASLSPENFRQNFK